MPKQATKTTRTRRYRITKKRPRKQTAQFKIDRGKYEQTITLRFPENTQLRDSEIEKGDVNPNLHKIWCGNACIAVYLDTQNRFERGFVYGKDNEHCGTFEKHDLKNAFCKFGDLLKLLKNPNGYSTVVYRKGDKAFKRIIKKKRKK